jgi:hypothetical protein
VSSSTASTRAASALRNAMAAGAGRATAARSAMVKRVRRRGAAAAARDTPRVDGRPLGPISGDPNAGRAARGRAVGARRQDGEGRRGLDRFDE